MSAQPHRLMLFGAVLILASLLVGIAVPQFAVPRLALSVHLLGLMQGLLLMVLGVVWPHLHLLAAARTFAFVLVTYGCLAAWSANLLGAMWGAGNSIVPIAAGAARGTPVQEAVIVVMLRSAAVALIVSVATVAFGLRRAPSGPTPTTLDV